VPFSNEGKQVILPFNLAVRNTDWHSKHQLPDHPTLDQRLRWHIEHARNCPCPAADSDILAELKNRYSGKHQDFWIFFNSDDHRALGFWAAECAAHLLPYFEEKYSGDSRPREAILTLQEWVYTRKFSMPVIRGASFAAHAAAKKVNHEDQAAVFAAHAAGQAVATAHVPTHALGTIFYAIKLAAAIHPLDVKGAIDRELEWEAQRLPENLHDWVNNRLCQTLQLLPKDIRAKIEIPT
jgi:hypothetical protein